MPENDENSSTDTADLERIRVAMRRWRLMAKRRIIGQMALRRALPGLELLHLDVIEAVQMIGHEGEVTIGAIAEAMHIDPSRGSRLVSQLVDDGLLERRVSQADARRTVVALAGKAKSFDRQKDKVHRTVIETVTTGWPEEDVERFADLLTRFIDGLEAVAREEKV